MKAHVSAWRTGPLRLCIQCIFVYSLLLISFRAFVHVFPSEGDYFTWNASEVKAGAPIDDKLFRAMSAETFFSTGILSGVSCAHKEYCIIENACVQPPKVWVQKKFSARELQLPKMSYFVTVLTRRESSV
jgi:hypothetical protein